MCMYEIEIQGVHVKGKSGGPCCLVEARIDKLRSSFERPFVAYPLGHLVDRAVLIAQLYYNGPRCSVEKLVWNWVFFCC